MSQHEDHFKKSKLLVSASEESASAERAMLKKETQRMMQESANFEKSKSAWRKNLMKASLVIAGISVVLNIVQAAAIAALTPLKTVEPYLLYVDKSVGLAEVWQPLDKSLPTYGEEVDKFFIAEYIRARESYDWGLAQLNYDKVKSFSELNRSVFNEYDAFIKSPKSPLTILADKARVVADVTSITLNEKTSTATIRFTKTIIAADGMPSINIPKTFWVATVSYDYPNPKLKPEERRLNPLGMKIPSYQLVQEQFRG
jgi:type IV secretion system protein VirB8